MVAAIRPTISWANSIGMTSPSRYPCASATDQLLVAIAFAPAANIAFALPASHALYAFNVQLDETLGFSPLVHFILLLCLSVAR